MQGVAVFQTSKVEGEVLLKQKGRNVLVTASFTKLPEGEHGFHIHKAGDLRGEGCKGACDHFTYGSDSHIHGGPPSSEGRRHTGDLGNIRAGRSYRFVLKNLPLAELFGRSVIVHQDPDDLGLGEEEDSKTTGHSGARIGCAVIGRVLCSTVGTTRRIRPKRHRKNLTARRA